MLVGVAYTLVVVFFVFVLFGVGGRIAALPEGFNKVIALLVVRELLESRPLFVGDDPDDVFFQPLLIRAAQFLLQRPLIFLLLFFIGRTLERICGIGCWLRLRGIGLSRGGRYLLGAGSVTGGVVCEGFGALGPGARAT